MTGDTISSLESDVDVEGELPDSIDEAAIERMRTVAWVLDESVRVPGTNFRVGLDPVLGVLPGSGDAIGAGFSLYIVLESARLGVTYTTLLRMLANITIDVAGGLIPVVGAVFDAIWKANKRNVELALRELASDQESDAVSDGQPADDSEVVDIPVE